MPGESQKEPGAEPDPSVITTEIINREIAHLRDIVDRQLEAVNILLRERDMRYSERFDAQQLAVKDALSRAKEEVAAAFAGSEKAILKAEVSIEKRADATYVSLQELSRSLAVLMPRAEVEARLNALTDQSSSLGIRVERQEAIKTGGVEARNGLYAFAGFLVALLVIGGFVAAVWPR